MLHSSLLGRATPAILMALSSVMVTACIGGSSSSGGGSNSDGQSTPQHHPHGEESITLSWIPPSTRVDGSSIYPYELARYEIRYGTVDGVFSDQVMVEEDTTTATIENLSAGVSYIFQIRVYDADGRASGYSPHRQITINQSRPSS